MCLRKYEEKKKKKKKGELERKGRRPNIYIKA